MVKKIIDTTHVWNLAFQLINLQFNYTHECNEHKYLFHFLNIYILSDSLILITKLSHNNHIHRNHNNKYFLIHRNVNQHEFLHLKCIKMTWTLQYLTQDPNHSLRIIIW